MINTIIRTKPVNVRDEIENIDKDLGDKTGNVNELAFLKLKSKANTFKHKR